LLLPVACAPPDKLLVIGHSLGGGVAKISGIKAGVKGVAFNAPGLLFSAQMLDLRTSDINANVVNIRSETDAISAIDSLGGLVQTIKCYDANGDWVSCHSVINQAAELHAACRFADKRIWAEYA
jgi:lipase ATG15